MESSEPSNCDITNHLKAHVLPMVRIKVGQIQNTGINSVVCKIQLFGGWYFRVCWVSVARKVETVK
jgi:hypothetical protein